jgi:cytidine deaminase
MSTSGTESVSAATIAALLALARSAQQRAYAPYSRHPVGAAILTPSGSMYSGCNVENASFGLTVCAERTAVAAAVAAGERAIVAVAVTTPTHAAPCGACRQVLAEFLPAQGEPDMLVIIDEGQHWRTLRLSELLPQAFLPRDLRG